MADINLRNEITITIDGNNVTDKVISYTRDQQLCTGMGNITIVMVDDGTNYYPWDEIILYEGGTRKGTYYASRPEFTATAGKMTINAQDNSKKLADYFIARSVVGNKDWLMTASCSAGPAFEGGGLSCGMRAMTGAIEGFKINPVTFEPMLVTIGKVRPVGICGSGAINILAEFLLHGVIDQNGKFNLNCKTRRLREGRSGMEYVLSFKEDTGLDHDVVLTEADIDNLTRAKAAMFAGYQSLLGKAGLAFQDLEQVVIAGAFGDFINLEITPLP